MVAARAAAAEPLSNDLVVSVLALVMPVQDSSAAVFVVVAVAVVVASSSVSFPTGNSLVDNRLHR